MNYRDETRLGFPANIAWQVFPDRSFVYILNLKNSQFTYFDDVSIDIWLHIDKGLNLGQIIQELRRKYGVDSEMLRNDVVEFANELIAKEVLEVKG